MRWSFRIGRVAGTDVKVHVTFLLLPAFWGWVGYQENGMEGALLRVLFILALFLCVLLHEFGHITMARRFGVSTPDVILLPIGGVARLQRIPDRPKHEFLIAAAGPAVTLLIAALLYLWMTVRGLRPELPESDVGQLPFVTQLLLANVMLLLFNLLPAFPLDGGRLLRALLASRMGVVRGTRVAAGIGQAIAVVGGLLALNYHAPLLVLIAVFVFLGAGAETTAVETRAAGEGIRVANMMVTDFRTIPIHATLSQAVDLLLAGEQREFPVVDNLGRTEGILTRDNLIRGLNQHGPGSSVAEAMTPNAPAVSPTLPFQEALDRLRSSGLPALPVVDATGALVGLLTLDNITDLLLVRGARR